MEGSSDTVEGKSIEELLLKSREDDGIDSKSNEQDEDSVGDSDVEIDDDLNEDLESVEGDDEIEEEECAENENIDVETTEATTSSKGKKMVKNISGKKRKRKRKDNTKRRDIRKILDESQLEKETLHAQLEEKERLRRLELQKSLATEMSPALTKDAQDNLVSTENANEPSRSISPMVVDFRQKSKQHSHVIVIDSDDDNSGGVQKQQEIEIISSDSVSSSSESDTDNSDIDENNVGMHSDDTYNVPNSDGNVEVNINHPLYEDDIYLAPQIAKHVKPHQIGGIRFLYDNLVETLARYKVSSGFGCILAHSMGLGKTLQVIAFVDIFLQHTPAKKVLCVVPINTIQNWLVEFNMWLPPKPEIVDQENKNSESEDSTNEIRYRNFTVYQLADNNKTTIARAKIIGEWNQNGGVLLIGYELYRILAMSTPCMASNKCAPPKRKKSNTSSSGGNQEPEVIDLEEEEKNMDFLIGIQNALCKPGPDLVICDEGHRIKNNQSNISQALKKVKTRRRVVLTGYPLQNNLIEYWCMVDFVRPNFLGTRQEFSNMFERPILNGQCSDSTPSDVRLMRYRAHVLHSLLEGFVQRRSQSVLKKCLPFKEEHIILVKLSPIQSQLYNSYIKFLLDSVGHLNPIKGFHTCTKIWNHPDVFFANLEPKKYGMRNESPLTLLDNDTEDGTSQEVNSNMDPALMFSVLPPQVLQQDPYSTTKPTPVGLAWAKDIMKDYQPFIEEQGGKIVILMEILEESLSLGEKVLVFSQSLSTLCIIEDFLSKRDIPHFPGRNTQDDPTKWAKNKSYFRLDGSTPSQERDRLITAFNSPDNADVLLFMLSTRAGCLGVNLIGASRVVVFDASWNPCHDVQAVCRVYRYGQKKPSHIYRLVSTGTMEKKIYDRQVSKQGVANRVVDELNPEANFTKQEIMSLICDKEPDVQAEDVASAANKFSDLVLKRICRNCSNWLSKVPFKHESLLVDKKELKLTKREKREAKKGYEREKNMAQQGGRYNYNPTEPKRIPPAVPPLGNIIRPVAAAYPMQSAQPTVMTSITQRTQSQAFAFNLPQVSMGSNQYRFASLNHNGSTNPIQLRALLPSMGISRSANPSLRMPINPVAMSTSVTNSLGSPLIFPSQAAILANANQQIMQAGTNFASNLVSSLPGNLTNGNIMSKTSVGCGLPLVSSGQTRPRTNDVVTIDLDDVPSPPEYVESQNDTTNKLQGQEHRKDNTRAKQTSSTAESLKSCESESMAFDQQPFVSMETSDKILANHVNTSTFASMATENVVNAGYSSEPVAMGTGVARGDDAYTSMNELLGNGLQSPARPESSSTTGFTDSQLTLAVLQNLLNARGGLDASASSPEESTPDNSSSSTSQL